MLYNPCPDNPLVPLVAAVASISATKAARVLRAFPRGSLATASVHRLQAAGCTIRQAQAVAAAVRLSAAVGSVANDRGGTCRTPADVVDLVQREIGAREQECFVVALLDSRQRLIELQTVAVGSLASVEVHPREVFRDAIRLAVHAVIVAHNHPSGDASPSEADLTLTARLAAAGRLVGIPLLDHLIVTRSGHSSLASLGLMPAG